MLNPLITASLFLVASIASFIAAGLSLKTGKSIDNLYLGVGLFCALVSIAMYRKYNREKGFNSNQ